MKKILCILSVASTFCWFAGCGKAPDLAEVREQAREAGDAAADAIASYEAGDLSGFAGFRTQMRALKASLAAQDFSRARECADQLDALLQTRVVAQAVEFLRVESREGAQKAREWVVRSMEERGLGETELKACREMIEFLENIDDPSRTELVAAIVYIALESRMGHAAAVPAAFTQIVLEEFLGDGSAVDAALDDPPDDESKGDESEPAGPDPVGSPSSSR